MTTPASARTLRFRAQVVRLSEAIKRGQIDVADLVLTAKASGSGSLAVRAAALRVLVALAPLSVTRGRPYVERRAAVRAHHGI